MNQSDLQTIVSLFAINEKIKDIQPLGDGLINDTFVVITEGEENDNYVLQRINTNVFPDVDMVMRNIDIVTTHLRKKLSRAGVKDIKHKVLKFIALKDHPNKLYANVDDNFWRLMVFIDHAVTKNEVNAESCFAAGKAFGNFQAMLSDVHYELGETIADFHNIEFRIEQLKQAAIEDRMGRFDTPEVQTLLEEIGKHC